MRTCSLMAEAQPILSKDFASERNESLLSNCRAPLNLLQRYEEYFIPPNKITNIFQLFFVLREKAHSKAMWTTNYRYEYPLQINRIWEKGTKWKVKTSFRHFVITTFANWTPPWSKWIVAMLSEWISRMKKFGSPSPIPSPSYHPGQPHWQRGRWCVARWGVNDEMT